MSGAVEEFLSWIGKDSTRNLYEIHLRKFSEFLEKDLDSYVAEPEKELAMKDLRDWIEWMAENNYSFNYVKGSVSTVRRFLEEQGINFSESDKRKLNSKTKNANRRELDKAGTKEEWLGILKNMDLRGRSLYLFLLSSGCRIGEALSLEKDNFTFESNPPKATIEPETEKTDQGRTVFFTPEAKDEILNWLDWRKNLEKRVRGLTETQKKELSEEEKKKKRMEIEQKRNEYKESKKVWPFGETTVRSILRNALNKSNIDEYCYEIERNGKTETRWKIHPHSTRKFFKSNLSAEYEVVEFLLGHTYGNDVAYRKLKETDRPEKEYLKHMHNLTFFEPETATKEDLQKERRLIQYDMLMSEARRKGVPKTKLSSYESKFREMEKIVQSTDLSPDELIGDIDIVSEQTQALEEIAKSSGAPRTHREKIEVSFPENVRGSLFKRWVEHIRDLIESEEQKSRQKVVKEDEVEEYLNEGWRFVNKLNNNEAIVEK